MKVILVRADASSGMGTGHLMRCMALAQACRDAGNRVVFFSGVESSNMVERITTSRMEHVAFRGVQGGEDDIAGTIECAKLTGARWVVLDGYFFDESYETQLKNAGLSVLVVDDKGERTRYCADIVVNQNLHAIESMYMGKCGDDTRLLLGSQYVMLREEFLRWLNWRREIRDVPCNILVTLGGADPDNMTCKVLSGLAQVRDYPLQITVVVGGSNLHLDDIVCLNDKLGLHATILHNVIDMPGLIARMDMAVSAGGTTVWELAYMGLPTLVGRIAPAEDLLVAGLTMKNLFVNIGWFSEVTAEELVQAFVLLLQNRKERERLAELGRSLVDGRGTMRVMEAMGL